MRIIDADKVYMYPDEGHMKAWFDEFNMRFFDNKLPLIRLDVEYGQKHTVGCFYSPKGKKGLSGFHPEECCILLNFRFFTTEDVWRNTMLHEMLHYFVYMKYGETSQSHGKEFKAEAKRINAISGFKIDTYSEEILFRPKPSITEHWGEKFDQEVIIGNYEETIPDEFVDEDTHEIYKLERCIRSFSFRTKRRFIPEIIDNMRNVRGNIEWFQVDEGCQMLFLLPITTAVPSFKPEETYYEMFVDQNGRSNGFGPIKWTKLGRTEFVNDGVQGYVPGQRKDGFRQQYFRDAKEIGRLAAEMLVKRYIEQPRWYRTTIHSSYQVKPSCGDYAIHVDSRFRALVAMTPKKILINPVYSNIMMEHIMSADTDLLADEIARVILSRQ